MTSGLAAALLIRRAGLVHNTSSALRARPAASAHLISSRHVARNLSTVRRTHTFETRAGASCRASGPSRSFAAAGGARTGAVLPVSHGPRSLTAAAGVGLPGTSHTERAPRVSALRERQSSPAPRGCLVVRGDVDTASGAPSAREEHAARVQSSLPSNRAGPFAPWWRQLFNTYIQHVPRLADRRDRSCVIAVGEHLPFASVASAGDLAVQVLRAEISSGHADGALQLRPRTRVEVLPWMLKWTMPKFVRAATVVSARRMPRRRGGAQKPTSDDA